MELTTQVGIVSVFGRGHWQAAALAQAKIPVTLIEVSSQMGDWSPEDCEGPFGFFEFQDLQWQRLQADEEIQTVAGGCTLWLKSGPVEMRGPTTAYRLQQLQVPDSVSQYIQNPLGSKAIDILKGLSFRETWLAHWAHGFSSAVDTLSVEAGREMFKRNLFLPFHVRQSTSQGLEKSLRWCESLGVKVIREAGIVDLGFNEKKSLGSLEIQRDKTGLFRAEQFVFCLTAEESAMLGVKVQTSLFGSQVKEPEWAWVRYEFEFQGEEEGARASRDQISAHCVVIEDPMLPWSHENMMIMQRRKAADQFDIWIKIPNSQRFHSQYLQERAEKMKAFLEERMPDNRAVLLKLPREAGSTFQKLGPTRNPVFSRALRQWRKNFQEGNVSFDSPEFWKSLSWEGQYEHQQKIFQNLKAWWDRKEDLRIKREAKEAAKRKNRGADL